MSNAVHHGAAARHWEKHVKCIRRLPCMRKLDNASFSSLPRHLAAHSTILTPPTSWPHSAATHYDVLTTSLRGGVQALPRCHTRMSNVGVRRRAHGTG